VLSIHLTGRTGIATLRFDGCWKKPIAFLPPHIG